MKKHCKSRSMNRRRNFRVYWPIRYLFLPKRSDGTRRSLLWRRFESLCVFGSLYYHGMDKRYKNFNGKNPSYWDKDKVYLSNIVIDIDAQTSNSIGKFQQGAYDVIQIPQSFIAQFTDKKEYRQMADTTTWFLQFNCKNKYFANPKIRQAFAMAVDKEIFINQVRKGLGLKAYALSHPLIALEGAYPLKDAKRNFSVIFS